MELAFTASGDEVLKYFNVEEQRGLSGAEVQQAVENYGRNGIAFHSNKSSNGTNAPEALPEDPPTPLWALVLEQFKDQLVLILLGSAAISFVLALFEEGDDWTAFVDPVVVSFSHSYIQGPQKCSQ